MIHIGRSIQPAPGAAPIINLGTPITYSLPNGLTLLIVENHQLPQVGIRLSLDECPELEKEKKGNFRPYFTNGGQWLYLYQ